MVNVGRYASPMDALGIPSKPIPNAVAASHQGKGTTNTGGMYEDICEVVCKNPRIKDHQKISPLELLMINAY